MAGRKSDNVNMHKSLILDLLLGNTSAGFASLDRNLNYILINEELAKFDGRPVADHIGKHVSKFVPDLFPAIEKIVGQIIKTGKPVRHQFNGHYAVDPKIKRYWDMYWYPVQSDKAITGFVLTVHEITRRVRAERSLRRSTKKYRELVENVNSVIVRWKADGKISFMNRYGLMFFGYKPRELIGKSVSILVPDRDSLGNDLSRLVQDITEYPEQYLNNINENICKDGNRAWISWTNNPVFDDKGKLVEVLAIGNDITDLKNTQEALRASESRNLRLASFPKFNPNPVIEIASSGKVMFCNLGAQKTLESNGMDRDDCSPFLPEDIHHLLQRLKKGESGTFYRQISINDKVYTETVQLISEFESIRIYANDVTERAKMEEALLKSEHVLEERVKERTAELEERTMLLDAEVKDFNLLHGLSRKYLAGEVTESLFQEIVDAAIAITNSDKGNMQLLDPSSKELKIVAHRYFSQRFLTFFDSVEGGEAACGTALGRMERVIIEDVSKSNIFSNTALEVLLKEGIHAVQSTPLVTRRGNVVGMLSTHFQKVHTPSSREMRVIDILARLAADIIDRKMAEDEQHRLEENLRQSQKMEAIGTLAGGIAHDFNNILAAIIGFTEMSIEDVSDRPLVKKNLQRVIVSAIRARELVKQILAFSRKASYERTHIAIWPIVEETVKLIRASIPASIEITLKTTAESDVVRAAPTEIQQIVMNLATNASLAMSEKGGVLEIHLTDAGLMSDASVVDKTVPAEYIQLMVKDTGIGMSSEVMRRVFEPFFTTREQGEGTGMGLAVVYGIVSDLQGEITIESKLGGGSTFRVFLPKAKEKAAKDGVPGQIMTGTEKILFIDDEDMLVQWAQITLEKIGYHVTAINDPNEAIMMFSSNPLHFDLVITDQAMPTMSGMQLAKKCLEIRPDIPIILCTGHSPIVSPEVVKKAGIKQFLTKPLTRHELSVAIRDVLEG